MTEVLHKAEILSVSRLGRAAPFLVGPLYALIGWFGVSLAVFPGYASPLFASSGLALAFHLLFGNAVLPGIWLGSFTLNLFLTLTTQGGVSFSAVVLTACIGAGAMLQAMTGTGLVRRFVPFPSSLDNSREVFLFLVLGGPVACLIGATVGVTSLWAAGILAEDLVWLNWGTWWIGDSLGVVLFTPLVLIWGAQPRETWGARGKYVAVPLVVAFAITASVVSYLNVWEKENFRGDFRSVAVAAAQRIQSCFREEIGNVSSLEELLQSDACRLTGHEKLGVQVLEPFDGTSTRVLYDSAGKNDVLNEVAWTFPARLGQDWYFMKFVPTQAYLKEHRPILAWALMALGLLFVGLLGAFLLVESGKTARIAFLVEERTRELNETKEILRRSRDELELRVNERTAELKRLNHELERSNAELERFAFVASHDMKEPLRMISSYVQLLKRRYSKVWEPEADEFVDYAVEGTVRLRNLIDDLLTYSRVGVGVPARGRVDLNRLLDEVLDDLRPLLAETNAKVDHAPLPEVVADPVQMRQLFQNLVSNSIRFRREVSPVVWVSAVRHEREWEFCVKDNGIGFEPEYAEKIFTLFQRLHSKDRYPGSGIGLAICKKIVEGSGGKIWADASPGNGASFYFVLPAAA